MKRRIWNNPDPVGANVGGQTGKEERKMKIGCCYFKVKAAERPRGEEKEYSGQECAHDE